VVAPGASERGRDLGDRQPRRRSRVRCRGQQLQDIGGIQVLKRLQRGAGSTRAARAAAAGCGGSVRKINVLCARVTTLTASACGVSAATGRNWWESVRTTSASVCASAASLLAPETLCRCRERASCTGLIANTVYPAATSAATHGSRSVPSPGQHLRFLSVLTECLGDHRVPPGHLYHPLRQPGLDQSAPRGVHQLPIVMRLHPLIPHE
jgi:hypothetical protein